MSRVARRRPVPRRARHAPGVRQHSARTPTTAGDAAARAPSIVAGLGEEGKLRRDRSRLHGAPGGDRVGAAARRRRATARRPQFELAATLIGSGGTGITRGQSAQLIAQGVREANAEAAATAAGRSVGQPDPGRALPRPRERSLARAAGAGDGGAEPAQAGRHGRVGRRRAAPPARLGLSRRRLRLHQRRHGRPGAHGDAAIAYTLDTKRARTEVRAQQTQGIAAQASWSRRRRTTPTATRRSAAPVPPAGAGRDGAVPRRHHRDADRARPRHRRHSVGAARHQPDARSAATRGRGRSAASCCASCAPRTSAPSRRTRAPTTACS